MIYCEFINFIYSSKQIIEFLPEIIQLNPVFSKNVYSCGHDFTKKIESILNLKKFDRILYFVMPPKHKSRIHIDMNTATGQVQKISFNLPLTKCDGVVMNWYDKKEGAVTGNVLGSHMSSFPVLEQSDSTLVATHELNRPMIATVDSWHNVENHNETGNDEHFISIRFPLETTHKDILDLIR
jgi:hypothetical protein